MSVEAKLWLSCWSFSYHWSYVMASLVSYLEGVQDAA